MAIISNKTLAFLAFATSLGMSGGAALALATGGEPLGSVAAYAVCKAVGGSALECTGVAVAVDPVGPSIGSIQYSIHYNPSVLSFDPTNSGPLGVFSIGGGAAAPAAGQGLQPLTLLPATGYNPGLPLGTVTYTQSAGFVAVDYELTSPISVTEDSNFFLLSFNFLDKQMLDLNKTFVQYSAGSDGNLFSGASLSCSPVACGSTHPTGGVTLKTPLGPLGAGAPIALAALLGAGWLRLTGRRHGARRLTAV